jgi:hypothetical protein
MFALSIYHLKYLIMKFFFALIEKTEVKNFNSCYETREMTPTEAQHLNEDMTRLVWVMYPEN